MTSLEQLYACPVCDQDPWNCTCLRKARARRIAFVIGYPTPVAAAALPAAEAVPSPVPGL